MNKPTRCDRAGVCLAAGPCDGACRMVPIQIEGPYHRKGSHTKRLVLQALLILVIGGMVSAVVGFSLGYFKVLP